MTINRIANSVELNEISRFVYVTDFRFSSGTFAKRYRRVGDFHSRLEFYENFPHLPTG